LHQISTAFSKKNLKLVNFKVIINLELYQWITYFLLSSSDLGTNLRISLQKPVGIGKKSYVGNDGICPTIFVYCKYTQFSSIFWFLLPKNNFWLVSYS